ncbi:MAG: hypothetical protein ABIY51_13585 [Ferruginibacter sp.]
MCRHHLFIPLIFIAALLFTTQFSMAQNEIQHEKETTGIIELRNYIIKPGQRDSFISYFENNLVHSQELIHGYPFARYTVKDYDDNFFWIRGFKDMATRSAFLPAFYFGDEWKKHRSVANNLLVNNDNVYLLKPIVLHKDSLVASSSLQRSSMIPKEGIAVIDFYISNTKLPQLLKLFAESYLPLLKENKITNYTLWTSVLEPNDFPRLPVFQDKDLLVKLAFYKDEADYVVSMKRVNLKMSPALKADLQDAITIQHTLILYPTKKTITQ